MNRTELPGSFRDPSGFLFRLDGVLYRQVNPGYEEHFELLNASGLYRAALDRGLLIRHEELDPSTVPGCQDAYKLLRPEALEFVSYPYEWSFSQYRDAALLTLELQDLALEHGLSLKDASAYNVQFHHGRACFIDTLSFEAYAEGDPWVAYQQFCKHFLAPLLLVARADTSLSRLMQLFIDGVPLTLASRLLPASSWLSASTLTHVHLHARSQRRHAGSLDSAARARSTRVSMTGLRGLIDNLRSLIEKLRWEPSATEWGDYYESTNYSREAHSRKSEWIARFIDEIRPQRVWDLGANTGMFSRLASGRKIPTVAFDVDPAAVEKNYLACRADSETHLLPLVMDLTNPSPGVGWASEERSSLLERGPADLVLALALIHHLAISNNVPLRRIVQFLRRCGAAAVVEFVPKSDSQVQRLLASRPDVFPDYDQAGFERALEGVFQVEQRTPIEGSERTLYLLRA